VYCQSQIYWPKDVGKTGEEAVKENNLLEQISDFPYHLRITLLNTSSYYIALAGYWHRSL